MMVGPERPQRGKPISARWGRQIVDDLAAARNFSTHRPFSGLVDSIGQAVTTHSPLDLQLFEITGAWTEQLVTGSPYWPYKWHFATAKPVIFYQSYDTETGRGWKQAADWDEVRLWDPLAYQQGHRPYDDDQDYPGGYAIGDWVWAMPDRQSGLWLIVCGMQAGYLLGVLDGPLTAGSTATMSIYGSAGDTGADITVRDYFMLPGDALPSGTKVGATYVPYWKQWIATEATCPPQTSSSGI